MMTFLHVVFGTVALIVVPAALFARKGGRWHKRFGSIFTLSMFIVLLSAGFLWQAKGHLFLVPLGAVTGYLVFNGWRVIARRRRRRADWVDDGADIVAAWAVIAAGVATAYLGGTAATPLMHSIAPALIAVGGIAVAFGMNDLLGFRARRLPNGWKLAHVAAMLAAYIAAVTAFLVINAHELPMLWRWVIPSGLGTLMIAGAALRILATGSNRYTIGRLELPIMTGSRRPARPHHSGSRRERVPRHDATSRNGL